MSLVEALIASAVSSAILAGAVAAIVQSAKLAHRSEFLGVQRELRQEFSSAIKSVEGCVTSVRATSSQYLTYNATASMDVTYVRIGEKGDVLLDGSRQPVYNGVLKVTAARLRDAGVPPSDIKLKVSGVSTDLKKYKSHLDLEVEDTNGERKTLTFPFNSFVDPKDSQLKGCTLMEEKKVLRAIATRIGVPLAMNGCESKAIFSYYNGVPYGTCMGHYGAAQVPSDFNEKHRCKDNVQVVNIPHPDYATDAAQFVKRAKGDFPVSDLVATAGRCPVKVSSNSTGYANDDIFVVINASTSPSVQDGLGCNAAGGWFLSNCMMENTGYGDSDLVFGRDAAGNEGCGTMDWSQPHNTGWAWGAREIRLTVICMKATL